MPPLKPIAALLAAACALAQAPPEEVTFRVSTSNVLVDVTVTDKKGHPVAGLEPTDFELLQDGKRRAVKSVQYISLPARAGVARPAIPKQSAGPIKREDVRRTIAFVVDDLGLSLQSISQVRTALRKFIDQQLQPGDLVAVIRTTGGMGALQQFTTNPALLRVSVDRLRYYPMSRMRDTGEDQTIAEAEKKVTGSALSSEARAERQSAEMGAVGALGTLNFLVNGLAGFPGRKTAVLFSESLPLRQPDDSPSGSRAAAPGGLHGTSMNFRIREALNRMADSATRNSVAVHVVNARGIVAGVVGLPESGRSGGRAQQPATDSPFLQSLLAQEGLEAIALQTGGTYARNTNDLNDALVRTLDADASYYTLAYEPDPEVFQQPAAFHRIEVRVKRSGLAARSRTGFFGTAGGATNQPASATAAALLSPFIESGLGLKLSASYFQGKQGQLVDAQLLIDAADLTFTDEPDGRKMAVVETTLMTLNETGAAENSVGQNYTFRLTQEQLDDVRKRGLLYRVQHPVTKPGAYLMRAVLVDRGSGRVGTATQIVDIPNLKSRGLVLASLAVSREQEGTGGAADRLFAPGDTILYGAQLLNSTPKPKAGLQREWRLYCEGDLVGQGELAAFTPVSLTEVVHPVLAGRLQLGANARFGTYLFELAAVDPNQKAGAQRAAQTVEFTVAPR